MQAFQVNCLALEPAAIKRVFYSLGLSASTNSSRSPGERSPDQITAAAETGPKRRNPAPSGQCQCVYPARPTPHITRASSALLELQNAPPRACQASKRLSELAEEKQLALKPDFPKHLRSEGSQVGAEQPLDPRNTARQVRSSFDPLRGPALGWMGLSKVVVCCCFYSRCFLHL